MKVQLLAATTPETLSTVRKEIEKASSAPPTAISFSAPGGMDVWSTFESKSSEVSQLSLSLSSSSALPSLSTLPSRSGWISLPGYVIQHLLLFCDPFSIAAFSYDSISFLFCCFIAFLAPFSSDLLSFVSFLSVLLVFRGVARPSLWLKIMAKDLLLGVIVILN
jgi:hypothetical protein